MKSLAELNIKHNKYKSIDFKNKFKDKFETSELNKIFNSIGENVDIKEINSLATKSPNENKKLIFIDYVLLSNKFHYHKNVTDFFLKAFNREQPVILITHHKNKCAISFNTFSLKNQVIKNILKKYTYTSNFFEKENLDKILPLTQINSNSIIDFFDESCRRVIYYEKVNNFDFSYTITWEVIKLLLEISEKEKEIKKLNNKYKNNYNQSQKYEIHKQMKNTEEEINNLKSALLKSIS